MTDLVKADRPDLAAMTLDELAAAANEEFCLGVEKAGEVLDHMRAAGEYLWTVKERLPRKEAFDRWIVENWGQTVSDALLCIRTFYYWNQIVEAKATNRNQARIALRGLPPVRGKYQTHRARRYSDQDRELARSMRSDGYTYSEIAAEIGCTQTTAILWLDDGFRARQKQKNQRRGIEFRKRQKKNREQRLTRTIAKRKDPVSDAYSMIRKLTQIVDQGKAEVQDREGKEALRRAEDLLHQADAAIVKALGLK
jgi:transposase-like protein